MNKKVREESEKTKPEKMSKQKKEPKVRKESEERRGENNVKGVIKTNRGKRKVRKMKRKWEKS